MKKLLPLFITCALVAPAVLPAASFEGKVSFKMSTGKDKTQDITYNIKGPKIRIEMAGQGGMGGMIMDTEAKEMLMIMDEQKMYMTMKIPEAATEAATKKGEDVKLEKTGETEKILGHTATKYIATQKDTSTEMWLAEGLGTFMSFNQNNPMGARRGGSSAQGWERALAGKDLFPLRVVGKDKSGKETFRMQATAIDKTNLPDSMFNPPAGYEKLDMGGGGMGGMIKGLMKGMDK